MFTPTGIWGV